MKSVQWLTRADRFGSVSARYLIGVKRPSLGLIAEAAGGGCAVAIFTMAFLYTPIPESFGCVRNGFWTLRERLNVDLDFNSSLRMLKQLRESDACPIKTNYDRLMKENADRAVGFHIGRENAIWQSHLQQAAKYRVKYNKRKRN